MNIFDTCCGNQTSIKPKILKQMKNSHSSQKNKRKDKSQYFDEERSKTRISLGSHKKTYKTYLQSQKLTEQYCGLRKMALKSVPLSTTFTSIHNYIKTPVTPKSKFVQEQISPCLYPPRYQKKNKKLRLQKTVEIQILPQSSLLDTKTEEGKPLQSFLGSGKKLSEFQFIKTQSKGYLTDSGDRISEVIQKEKENNLYLSHLLSKNTSNCSQNISKQSYFIGSFKKLRQTNYE